MSLAWESRSALQSRPVAACAAGAAINLQGMLMLSTHDMILVAGAVTIVVLLALAANMIWG